MKFPPYISDHCVLPQVQMKNQSEHFAFNNTHSIDECLDLCERKFEKVYVYATLTWNTGDCYCRHIRDKDYLLANSLQTNKWIGQSILSGCGNVEG